MKRSPLIVLFLTLFIDLFGFGMILPLLPVYIQHYQGAPWVGGLLLAAFSTMQFLFAPIWGRASDRIGRRPLILLSLIGSAVSYFCFGAAPNLALLFVARVASGILTAASLPTAQAYIADVTPPEKRAGGMALIGAAFGLGFAFGPWLGGVLGQHSVFGIPPLAMPAYFAALLALFNFSLAFFLLPESHHDRSPSEGRAQEGPLQALRNIGLALRNPAIGFPLTVFTFTTFAFTAVESSFSWMVLLRFHLYGQAGAAVTSGIFGIVGVTILLTQLAVMAGLARLAGEHRLAMFGTLLLTACLIGIGLAHDLTLIRILSAFIAIGNGVLNPSLSALITQSAGPKDRGAISGAQQGLASLARIIAPPINNALVASHTGVPFFLSACLMGSAFFLSVRLRPITSAATPETASPPAPPVEAPTDRSWPAGTGEVERES